MQRAAIFSGANLAVSLAGLGARTIFGEGNYKLQFRVIAFEAFQVHLSKRGGGNSPGAEQFGQLTHGGERQVFYLPADLAGYVGGRNRNWSAAQSQGLLFLFETHPGKHGIKNQRRINRIGNVQLVDLFVAVGMVVQVFKHYLLVFFRNRNVRDGGGIFNHFLGDLFRSLRLRLRP